MKSAFYETIEDVKNNFGIDYLRHSSEASTGFDYVYSIHPAKDEQNNIWYLIYIYNKKGEVIDSFCIDKILKTYDFSENLKVDKSTLEDVLKIDINTQPVQTSDGLYESIHRCFGYGISVNVYIIYKKVVWYWVCNRPCKICWKYDIGWLSTFSRVISTKKLYSCLEKKSFPYRNLKNFLVFQVSTLRRLYYLPLPVFAFSFSGYPNY